MVSTTESARWKWGLLFLAALWGWQAAVSGDYLSLLGSRLFAGVAIVSIWTASINITGNVAARGNQATAITLYATSVPLGSAVGQFVTPVIANWFNWEIAMPLFGATTVLSASLFWVHITIT